MGCASCAHVTTAVYLGQADVDNVKPDVVEAQCKLNPHTSLPVQSQRSVRTLLLVTDLFFVSPPRFLPSAQPAQASEDDSWKEGCYWPSLSTNVLPPTSVKQNPSWLGIKRVFRKWNSRDPSHCRLMYIVLLLNANYPHLLLFCQEPDLVVEQTAALLHLHCSKCYWNESSHEDWK